jgi:hypothetical protein
VFSITGDRGQLANGGSTPYNAVLGPAAGDVQVTFSGSMTSFANANIGAVLRWTDTNDWYKAYLNGSSLVVQKKVSGSYTTLGTAPFLAMANASYSLRFQAVGTTLSAKAWPTGGAEPPGWLVTVTDSSFASGQSGLRTQLQTGIAASYTSFIAQNLSGTPVTPVPSPTAKPGQTLTSTPTATATSLRASLQNGRVGLVGRGKCGHAELGQGVQACPHLPLHRTPRAPRPATPATSTTRPGR